MICEKCKVEHSGNYGSSRFCSSKCARGYSSFCNKKEQKSVMCVDCKTVFSVNKMASTDKSRCNPCKKLHSLNLKIERRNKRDKKTRFVKIKKTLTCMYCGKPTGTKKFCNTDCKKFFNTRKFYEYFLTSPSELQVANFVPRRRFYNIFLEEQEHKCAICGCPNIHNGKKLVFVSDHIDGDASNNFRENIRMICPNCDSQLDTFKSKNKNSTRGILRKRQLKSKILKEISS